MRNNRYKSLIFLLIFSINLIVPSAVEARINFKKFFRSVRRGVSFVVSVPDKATRWMGPVIGPLASTLLTQNIYKNPKIGHIFRRAEQIDSTIKNVNEQKKYLENIKKNFNEQAEDLDKQAQTIRQSSDRLKEDLLSGEITFDDYKNHVVSLERIAQSYEGVADKFRQSADRINPSDLSRMLSRNVWRNLLSQIKDGVEFELKNEIDKYIDPNVIKTLVEGGNLSFDDMIRTLIARNVDSRGEYSNDELADRVKDRIRMILRENRDALKDNWMAEIDKIIAEEKEKLQKDKESLENVSETPQKDDQKEKDYGGGQDGCSPGYERCPRCGVDCRQINCNDVPSGHWDYVGRCNCGSAGSINENPDDPNKGCYYPNDYTSCPGCLYACVHTNEECPAK